MAAERFYFKLKIHSFKSDKCVLVPFERDSKIGECIYAHTEDEDAKISRIEAVEGAERCEIDINSPVSVVADLGFVLV